MCKLPCFHMCHILPHSIVIYIYTVYFVLCTVYNFLYYSYGLAPGRPFPAGHEDSIAVTKHVMENLENYGIVSNRIFTEGIVTNLLVLWCLQNIFWHLTPNFSQMCLYKSNPRRNQSALEDYVCSYTFIRLKIEGPKI